MGQVLQAEEPGEKNPKESVAKVPLWTIVLRHPVFLRNQTFTMGCSAYTHSKERFTIPHQTTYHERYNEMR